MEKKYLLPLTFFFLAPFLSLNAQITITQSDMPNLNDTLRVSITNKIDTLNNPDSTGANYVWNYSSLVPKSQDVEHFILASSTGYPFFPFISSYGYKTNKIDTTNRVDFFKKSATCYRQVGYGQKINALPAPVIYSPTDTIYNFPLNFGDMDSCNSGYGLPIPGIGYFGQNTKRVNNVDGWGTLTTPYGTFQTLRIKSTLYRVDTIYFDTLHFGISIPLPVQYEYKWLGQGEKIPLLLIVANVVGGNPVVSNVMYRDSMRAGVVQVNVQELQSSIFNFNVYPNPSNDFVFISYSLDKSENVLLELFDLSGRKVSDVFNKKQSDGQHIEMINLKEKELTSGIYFLRMTVGSKTQNSKIVIQ